GWPGSEQNKTLVLRIRACTHKCGDVGFWGLSGNLRLDQSITDFDPVQTCATRNLAAQMSISNPIPPVRPRNQHRWSMRWEMCPFGRSQSAAQHTKLPAAVIRHCHGCYSPLACRAL